MASEYLKWKYREVKPDEPPPPMTGRERLANWFYYNKWWIAAGAVLIYIVGSILWSALGIGQIRPDYIFAYVGSGELPEELADSLEEALAALGQDVNGDGQVVVELRQYAVNRSGDPETAMYYNQAADVALVADISEAESYFFLMEDAGSVQKAYQILARPDGTPSEEDDESVEDKVFLWRDCPVLSALAVEQEPLENLSLGRRSFFDEKQAEDQEANEALWEMITEGAKH